MTNPKEQVYDEQINPLMARIIEICNQHKIAMLASFAFCQTGCACHDGEGCACTTSRLTDDFDPTPQQLRAVNEIYGRPNGPSMMAITVTTKK